MKISIFLVLVFATISQTFAAGNPTIGKSKAIICIGCHGTDGNSSNHEYPKLAEQGESYLSKQLLDFKNGVRVDEHMTSMVAAIKTSDIPHIAAFFSQQKRKKPVINKTNIKDGKKIFDKGITSKGIPACANCHAPDGHGIPVAKFPSLAGQHTDYISKMLKDFRSATRHNDTNKIMRNIAEKLTDEEIHTISAYITTME